MTDPKDDRFIEAFDNFVMGKNSLTFNGMARTAIIILAFIIIFGLVFYTVSPVAGPVAQ
jgi:hypothetical protein